MIGTKNRQYAREILQCGTTRARVAYIGDSLAGSGGDGLDGMFPRLLNIDAFDGVCGTSANEYLLYLLGVSPSWATMTGRSSGNPSAATTIPDWPGGKQNYNPGSSYECICNENAVTTPSPDDYRGNRILTIKLDLASTIANRQTLRQPMLATSSRYGDVWLNRLNAGQSIKLRVTFFAGPHYRDAAGARVYLQVTNSTNWTKNIAQGAPFSLYAATPRHVVHELEIPATFGGEDTKDYWPVYCCVRVTEGDALYDAGVGDAIVVTNIELCATGTTGYMQEIFGLGGGSANTYVTTTNYLASAWQRFAADGVTHCIINLMANADASAVDNHEQLVTNIRESSPNMKFIILAPYNINASVSARADLLYAWAEANNHLWLSVEPWLPPVDILYQGIGVPTTATPGRWTNDAYYYGGENVSTTGSDCWTSLDTHTSIAAPGVFADDAAHWAEVTTFDSNLILQTRVNSRNFVIGDATHYHRGRGLALYSSGIVALLNMAAAMPLAHNVRAGMLFGPENGQKGTMPQAMVTI